MAPTMTSKNAARDFAYVPELTAPGPADYPWPWTGYSDKPDEMPLGGYGALLAAYVVAFGSTFSLLWSRQDPAARLEFPEAILFGIATHKIGRIVTRDWVTSPLRAPFTRYEKSAGGGEVAERSRGKGLRRAIGDLLTCPWCIAPWVAGGLYSVFLLNPRVARLLAAGFTSVAVSDVMQHAYGFVARPSQLP